MKSLKAALHPMSLDDLKTHYDETVNNTFTENTQGGEGGVYPSTTSGSDGGDGIITITFYEFSPSF